MNKHVFVVHGGRLVEGAMVQIVVDRERIAAFCRERGIVRLALFGSVLRGDCRADSDVDVLVDFAQGAVPGLFGIARLERELSGLFGERKVDLRTPADLSRCFRDRVLAEAQVQYARR